MPEPLLKELDTESCFSGSGLFLKSEPGGGVAFMRAESDCPPMRSLLEDPEAFLASASILKDSRSTKAGILKLEGLGDVFIKRYNNRGLRYTLRYLFRKCRAFRSWQAAWLFEQLEAPTPKPLAAVAWRNKAGVLGSSYLISQALESPIHTLELVKAMLPSSKTLDSFLEQLISHLGRLHDNGISHGDLKFSNLAASTDLDFHNIRFTGFLDLDGVRIHKHPLSSKARLKEIARLSSSFIEVSRRFNSEPPSAQTAETFLKKYADATGVLLEQDDLIPLMMDSI